MEVSALDTPPSREEWHIHTPARQTDTPFVSSQRFASAPQFKLANVASAGLVSWQWEARTRQRGCPGTAECLGRSCRQSERSVR